VRPIACSLNSAELAHRLAEMADLGQEALLHAESGAREARLRFAAAPGVLDRVRAIAAAEADCCPFLTFTVADEGAAVTLLIVAPDGAEPVLTGLVAAFSCRRSPVPLPCCTSPPRPSRPR
jgi:hypothetical protein